MAETARTRPVEYFNPRPLILGICFFWGVLMGFGINFFRGPEEADSGPATRNPVASSQPVLSEMERRRENTPDIAVVEPGPSLAPSLRPSLEQMNLDPPAPLLTTEGGLTGRTSAPLGGGNQIPGPTPPQRGGTGRQSPPPIPELMPR